ncbi:MAG: 3-methyl-2-oxobutanoate hydroxymethyltransferase [Leptospiraceae bacterium]|nr:3-methyl-2-oxobutanoate hydroxymethyltransferase [Leptospiraceae bacterium]MDW7974959.1 3-methyl-2-oxobutanoate hydroxymethyltransferase [Leptospiraceae bacterium]
MNLKYPSDWIRKKKEKELISVVTCYDFTMAKWISRTPIDAVLVGDSLGMVVQGNSSTLPVRLEEIIYHTKLVRRGAPEKFLIADMPLGSYQTSIQEGLRNSFKVIKETQCQALKFEGADKSTLKLIKKLVQSGLPVMGHIGLTPQSYLNFGGYKIQGRDDKQKEKLIQQAKALEEVGCFSIVLELTEEEVAKEITQLLEIPTIGIGSGNQTDGQVLVIHDLLGMDPDFTPKHAKRYANFAEMGIQSLIQFDHEVKSRKFPPSR